MNIRLFTIPNCVTLCNLLCGSAAAVMALVHHNLPAAFALVIAAAVFDFLDGFSARLLKSYSGIGVELDSLADMVSFGFAPAAILFTLFGTSESRWEWSETARAAGAWVPFLITAFSALRLAKFNVDDSQHTEFQGFTTTANAMFCASLGWLSAEGEITLSAETIVHRSCRGCSSPPSGCSPSNSNVSDGAATNCATSSPSWRWCCSVC